MKSRMRRPSQKRPAGAPKKVSPLGGGAWPNAAERPPVSELESPKLKMAGKVQLLEQTTVLNGSSNAIESSKQTKASYLQPAAAALLVGNRGRDAD
nr:hypothetical protein GW17_00061824 [Ipomoea trifida]GMD47021.1 nitrate transporter [Ipomoea batatas]